MPLTGVAARSTAARHPPRRTGSAGRCPASQHPTNDAPQRPLGFGLVDASNVVIILRAPEYCVVEDPHQQVVIVGGAARRPTAASSPSAQLIPRRLNRIMIDNRRWPRPAGFLAASSDRVIWRRPLRLARDRADAAPAASASIKPPLSAPGGVVLHAASKAAAPDIARPTSHHDHHSAARAEMVRRTTSSPASRARKAHTTARCVPRQSAAAALRPARDVARAVSRTA